MRLSNGIVNCQSNLPLLPIRPSCLTKGNEKKVEHLALYSLSQPNHILTRFHLKRIEELTQQHKLPSIRWNLVAKALCLDITNNNPKMNGKEVLWHSTKLPWSSLLDFLENDFRLKPVIELARREFEEKAILNSNHSQITPLRLKKLAEMTYRKYGEKIGSIPTSYRMRHWPLDIAILQFELLSTLTPSKNIPLLGIPLGFFEFLLLVWQNPSMEKLDLKTFSSQIKELLKFEGSDQRKACQNEDFLQAFEEAVQELQLDTKNFQ